MPAEILSYQELKEKNKKEEAEKQEAENAKQAAILNGEDPETKEPETREEDKKEELEFVDDDKDEADEPEFDAEGNPIEKTPVQDEDWLKTDDDEESAESVPVKTHVKVRQKLKGTISEKDDKIRQLEQKIEDLLKGRKPKEDTGIPKKPDRDEFDDDDKYQEALINYDDTVTKARFDRLEKEREEQSRRDKNMQTVNTAVENHYDRALKLTEEHKINPEVYQKADRDVREGVEAIMPGKGDALTNYLIYVIGEGSEKVIFYHGRNPKALNNLKALLAEDPSGIKAAVYLGQQKQRLTNPAKINTKGKPPPKQQPEGALPGSVQSGTRNEKKLRQEYEIAHKKGDFQASYDAKKAAKAQGIDVSRW